MIKRITAIALMICCLAASLPADALAVACSEVLNTWRESDVPPAEGDTGAPGIVAEADGNTDTDYQTELAEDEKQNSDKTDEQAHSVLYIRALGIEENQNNSDIDVSTGVLSMTVGARYGLQAFSEDGSVLVAEWKSGDEKVASVDTNGVVTGVGFGETEITASAGGLSAVCQVRVGRVAERISFKAETLYVGVGETVDPGIVIADGGEGYFNGYTLNSDNNKIARVNAEGTITGRKKGTAMITARTENNVSCSLKVVVRKAPSKVSASPKQLVLGLGETACIGYKLPSGTAGSASFKSLDEKIISVDPATGIVKAVGKGTAKIRITTYNDKTCTAVVKVMDAPESIAISDTCITLGVGQQYELDAALNTGAAAGIKWVSDAKEIVAVENGRIRAIMPGIANVSAETFAEGVRAVCTVTVKPAPEEVKLSYEKLYIGIGETLQLQPDANGIDRGFTYSSGKKACVTVSKDGVIRGKKKGTAVITVKAYNGKKASVRVTVGNAPSRIMAEDMVMGLFEKRIMVYSLPSGSYGSVRFESLSPDIVSVDSETGEISTLKTGEATVRIESYNKESCTAKVTVLGAPETVTVTPGTISLREGMSCMLTAQTEAGTATAFLWESSDTDVAVVENGMVSAVGSGTACIFAKSHVEGVYGECTVMVTKAPEKLTVQPSEIRLGIGEEITLAVTGGEPAGSYTFDIAKGKYASAGENGIVKGKAAGKTSLTVSSEDGQHIRIPVIVGKKPTKVTAVPSVITLGVGETAVMGYRLPKGCTGGATFRSLSTDIISVDPETGILTAKATGTAKVEISTYNGKTAQVTVNVSEAPESVRISEKTAVIGVGQKLRLEANVNDGAASAIRWESSDESVAVVKDGVVTGRGAGTANIIAKTYLEDVYAVCTVSVLPAPEKVILPESRICIGVGDSIRLEPDDGSVGEFTYSSSRKKIASVKKDGTITGLRTGSAKITVKAYNGKKAVVTVVVQKAPGKITPASEYVRMGLGDIIQLGYTLPAKTASTVRFEAEKENILQVDSATGMIKALAVGETDVILRTHNGKCAVCHVEVCPAPEWIRVAEPEVRLGVGQTYVIAPEISEGSISTFRYSVADGNAVAVSADGVITARDKGKAIVCVNTCDADVYADIPVEVLDAPEYVRLDVVEIDVNVDESFLIDPKIPDDSHTEFIYMSSDPALAEVSPEGIVRTRMRGEVFISAIAHNGKKADLKLNISDPWYPDSVELINRPGVLQAGDDNYALEYCLSPENARPLFVWRSSDERVAVVDQNGVITPLSYGYTTISAISEKNSDVRISFTLAVQESDRILEIPARTTDESGIPENLEKIDAIRRSAIAQVNALRSAGKIKASDASKRKSMINNIFKDYAFPWKTPSFQKYWKSANSDGGAKHFRTDRVYYGLPYVSGSGMNRAYTAAKALKEKRYTDSGEGYYLLNQKKLLHGRYVGSDCSGLVNTAIWGTSSIHTLDRTVEIADSKAYRTIKSFKSLRPGDLICLGYGHVVMFLYYADQDKTKVMVIENGGSEHGTNTVHCSVYNVSYYTKRGYRVRRLASLG